MPFAMIAGSRFGNYKDGFRFGRLGYELVENRGLTRYQARTYMPFGNMYHPSLSSSEKNCALFVSLKVEISTHVPMSRP
jgi:hypothetical protein